MKGIVINVVFEVFFECEMKDGLVNKVFVFFVEKLFYCFIDVNSDKIVGIFYFLVGMFVRKVVFLFFVEFVECINVFIENSLSFKSVFW